MLKAYAGLDVAAKSTSICVLAEDGNVILEIEVPSSVSRITETLKPYRTQIAKVGLESGTNSRTLYRGLLAQKLPVVCLDARWTHAALGAALNKTDKGDARGIAKVLARGIFTPSHVKSDRAQYLQALLTVRIALKRKTIELRSTLAMTNTLFGAPISESIAKPRASARHADATPPLERISSPLREAIANLSELSARLDELVADEVKSDPVCQRLMTVPGVGPITALTFRAGVDDPTRFKSSRTVAAYFGLTPRLHQSGGLALGGHISRHGSSTVRAALFNAAFALLKVSKSDANLRKWALKLQERKGAKFAAVACARRLAVIMHRMWVTERDFEAA